MYNPEGKKEKEIKWGEDRKRGIFPPREAVLSVTYLLRRIGRRDRLAHPNFPLAFHCHPSLPPCELTRFCR